MPPRVKLRREFYVTKVFDKFPAFSYVVELGQEGRLDEGAEAQAPHLRALDAEQDRPRQVDLQDGALVVEGEIAHRREVVEVGVFLPQARRFAQYGCGLVFRT